MNRGKSSSQTGKSPTAEEGTLPGSANYKSDHAVLSQPPTLTHSSLWPQGLKETVRNLGTNGYGTQYFVLLWTPVVDGNLLDKQDFPLTKC